MAPTKTLSPLVEMSTKCSKVTALRIVHGASTAQNAAPMTSAARSRAPQPFHACQTSGTTRTPSSASASPRVSAASAMSAPTSSPRLTDGARR